MIHDVDESLRALLRRDALNGSGVEVALDAPNKEWASRRNTPTLSLFLYDIREDVERREVQYEAIRDETGRVIERRPPPRRFRLSYLVTAWTQRPEDEHRLLSSVLSCLVRHDVLPQDVLAGDLAGEPLPLHVSVARPSDKGGSITDVWSSIGGELKPSIEVAVVAPLDTRRVELAQPLAEELVVQAQADDGAASARTSRRRRNGTS